MVSVKNDGPNRLRLRFGITLEKGQNEVDPAAWSKCKDDHITKHYLATQRICVVSVGGEVPAPQPVRPPEQPKTALDGLSARDAKEWVAECTDLEQLDQLLEVEPRPTVKNALEFRIAELDGPVDETQPDVEPEE